MTSVIFPGQGSQFPGMARDFYDNFREFKDVFLEIEDSTKINLDKIIFSENTELLNSTNFTQISIFAVSIGIYKTLESSLGFNFQNSNIKYMLGHSLGEYSALAASKSLSITAASLLLKKRGELMNSAVEPNSTSMAALIGLNCDKIEDIINALIFLLRISGKISSFPSLTSNILNLKSISKNHSLTLHEYFFLAEM